MAIAVQDGEEHGTESECGQPELQNTGLEQKREVTERKRDIGRRDEPPLKEEPTGPGQETADDGIGNEPHQVGEFEASHDHEHHPGEEGGQSDPH